MFMHGRIRLATSVLIKNGIPPKEKVAVLAELVFCLPGHAGVCAYFPKSHRVYKDKITDPAQVEFEELMWLFNHHQSLMNDMGWVNWQPAHEYVTLERRIREFVAEIVAGERELQQKLAASAALHADILLFWDNWKEMSATFGTSEVLMGRPFPTVTACALLQGSRDFPKFGSNFATARQVLKRQLGDVERPLFATSIPSAKTIKVMPVQPLVQTVTPALPGAVSAAAAMTVVANAAAATLLLKQTKTKAAADLKAALAAAPSGGTDGAKPKVASKLPASSLGVSPGGTVITWAMFQAHCNHKFPDDCARQWKGRVAHDGKGITKDLCRVAHMTGCAKQHAALADKETKFLSCVASCKTAVDKGWAPSETEAARYKSTGGTKKKKKGKTNLPTS